MGKLLSSRAIRQTYLRVSVTDRCNLRCGYCMPPGGRRLVRHEDLLTYEELLRSVRILAGMGVTKVRVTGGEPLVRKGVVGLLKDISSISGIVELCLTTNGTMLSKQATALRSAGVGRINVSLDSLRRESFKEITGQDSLEQVLEGLDVASSAGFDLIKINTILFRGINDDEIGDFVKFSTEKRFKQRFIELMPFRFPASKGVTETEVRTSLKNLGLPSERVEFISQITKPFCSECGRLRIDARGRLKACLLSRQYLDLHKLLRTGVGDDELSFEMNRFVSVAEKRLAEESSRWESRAAALAMSEIGG